MATAYERWISTRKGTSSTAEKDVHALIARRGGIANGSQFVEVLRMLGYDRRTAGGICAKVERNAQYA